MPLQHLWGDSREKVKSSRQEDFLYDDPTIDMILRNVRGYIEWDQSYSIVPSRCVGSYFNKQNPKGDDSEEIITISYG